MTWEFNIFLKIFIKSWEKHEKGLKKSLGTQKTAEKSSGKNQQQKVAAKSSSKKQQQKQWQKAIAKSSKKTAAK